ncbi:MAG: MBL fold metallo-hydrolase [Acidiferrobacterales bacterium]|nr:MBL fold metallo-hydrolase [Acidiferrobacterales bacterium]
MVRTSIPFQLADEFEYGELHEVSPLIRRIVAKNPSKFTYLGTGTYIVGRGEVAVIDPGPRLESHIRAIAESLSDETITHILVTHTHSDHSPAARPLQSICGAPVYGFSTRPAENDIEVSERLEEDVDHAFHPDIAVKDGDLLRTEQWTLQCVHTPGHMSNHMCYRLLEEKALFSGDHVMGWSTTVIIPPDGSMSDYLASLRMLLDCDDQIYYPTHGPPIRQPHEFLHACIEHRRQRELQILECLQNGLSDVMEMVPVVYRDTDVSLHAPAARSLFATIIKLWEEGTVTCQGAPALDKKYRLA